MNAHISDNTAFPTPYSSYNYNPSMNHPQYQGYPYLIPNTPEVQAQREEDRKKMEAYRCKIAREQRKQLLQKRRSTPSKASEGTRQPIYIQVREPIVPNVFFTPDGKVMMNYFPCIIYMWNLLFSYMNFFSFFFEEF